MKLKEKKLIALVLALLLFVSSSIDTAYAAPVKETINNETESNDENYEKQKASRVQADENEKNVKAGRNSEGTIYTSYIQCYVHEDGGFNIGTADGDCLLYNYPTGNTSQTLIRIDGGDYYFNDYVTDITFSADGKSCIAVAEINGIKVTQTLSIIKNPNSSTENVVAIRYTCANNSSKSRNVGVRIMLDTMLGHNDGAPFKVNGKSVTTEREYIGDSIPKYYQAFDNLTNPDLTATGYFYYTGTEKPDKVQFAYWWEISDSDWDYSIDPTQQVINDSAVAAYFGEETLAVDSSRTVSTYYGAYETNIANANDNFNYTNSLYSQELAEYCGKYSAYAYQDYKYNVTNNLFYEDKKSAKKDTKKNNRSYGLNVALDADNYKHITPVHYNCPTEDSATYTLGHKKVNYKGSARNLIFVVIRGTNGVEWQGNMNVTGTSYQEQDYHNSFQNGANQIEDHLIQYMSKYNLDNPIVLITGHSRGGGIGNLLAADLTNDKVEQIDEEAVFAYLFAVPNVTTDSYSDEKMPNIFNFCFTDDFVPSLPLKEKWGYGKNGQRYEMTADEEDNKDFLYSESISIDASEGINELFGERVSFDAGKTEKVVDYVKKNWDTVEKYYNKKTYLSLAAHDLYSFMHDSVAPAAMNKFVKSVALLAAQKDSTYGKIADFFVEGTHARHSINDTHQMYTYYNALKNQLFKKVSESDSKTVTENSTKQISKRTVKNTSQTEADALITFANTGNNLELLGWTIEDTSTWTGINWDENGRVSTIDLCYLGLTGSLDLTAFEGLTEVDVSGNAIESLVLPNAENSVLHTLDCSYNKLTTLDISGQTLELLDCTYNYLDVSAMEESVEGIEYASYVQQLSAEEKKYSENDFTILKEKVLKNDEIWGKTDNPEEWIGVTWKEDNGIYYVSRLELSEAGLVGELDISGLSHLEYLDCSGNEITSIVALGCEKLKFVNCNANDIEKISIPEAVKLDNLYCSDNYLTMDEISALNAENVNAGHQQVQGDISEFCNEEYEVLSDIAEVLEYNKEEPGSWGFVTWEKEDALYHVKKLDLSNQNSLNGTLDLSSFEYLNEVYCGSTGYEKIKLPEHMTVLNSRAFSNCESLREINLPDNLVEIGEAAFYNCSTLTGIQFSEKLQKVGVDAFNGCMALELVCFPESLVEIGNTAFQNCTNLVSAYFTGDAPVCGENAFMYVSVGFSINYLENTNGWNTAVWESYITDEKELFSIINYPEKMIYEVNEDVDTTGLVLLKLGKDGTYWKITDGYSITPEAFDEAGTHTVRISYGEDITFYEVYVQRQDIENAEVYLEQREYEYTGDEIQPKPIISYGEKTLVENVDYEISYLNNTEPGYAEINISGINAYMGSVTIGFSILYNRTVTVTDWKKLESEHYYKNGSHLTWIYDSGNKGKQIELVFDENTCFEYGYDVLYIYDSKDTIVGSYTGDELVGKSVIVDDSIVKIVLITDLSSTEWGFKVKNLKIIAKLSAPVVSGKIVASSGKTKLTWGKVSKAAKYKVYRSMKQNGTYTNVKTTTSTSYTDTSAKAGVKYFYYVVALNNAGDESLFSNKVSFTCKLAQPKDVVVKKVASSGKLTVKWTAVSGAKKYEVYRKAGTAASYTKVKTTTAKSYTDTAAKPGIKYYYKVKAICEKTAGNSAFSVIKSGTSALAQPKVTITRDNKGKPKLKWAKINSAVKYKVYRSTSKNGTYKEIKTTASNNYTDTTAKKGKKYFYKVKAICKKTAGNSANSVAVSITSK